MHIHAASPGAVGFPWLTSQRGAEFQRKAPGQGTQAVPAPQLLKLCLHFRHCLPPWEEDGLKSFGDKESSRTTVINAHRLDWGQGWKHDYGR